MKRSRKFLEHKYFRTELFVYRNLLPLLKVVASLTFNEVLPTPIYYDHRVFRNFGKVTETRLYISLKSGGEQLCVEKAVDRIALLHASGFALKQLCPSVLSGLIRRNLNGGDKFRTVCHGDLWRRNFVSNKSNVSLVDFQFTSYDSCALDFTYFACMNGLPENLDRLIHRYHSTLSNLLGRIDTHVSFEEFLGEVREALTFQLPIIYLVLRGTLKGDDYHSQLRTVQAVRNRWGHVYKDSLGSVPQAQDPV